MKFVSRKFIAFVSNFVAIVVLSFLGKIDGLHTIIGLLVNCAFYTLVEGAIDLASLRKIQIGSFSLDKEVTNEDN
ncbi:MAG: hypothetical protein ABDH28_05675 [Brevinematia bacterium]